MFMKLKLYIILLPFLLVLSTQYCNSIPKSQTQSIKTEIDSMAKETKDLILEHYPDSKSISENAEGIAIFENFGFKFMFFGSTRGRGLAINKKTNEKTYMKMRELHPGFGFGGQHFKTLFIFDTKEAYESFIETGWEFGGNILATSNITSKGGGFRFGKTISRSVTMYQLSEKGFIIGISITGGKYSKIDELN